jgi:CRISPR-associated protein Csb2
MSEAASIAAPAVQSPWALCRWRVDYPIPVGRSRELAAGLCGALLPLLGPAVAEVVLKDRLAVVALPRVPLPPAAEAEEVGLLVPRKPTHSARRALRTAVDSVLRAGFPLDQRNMRMRPRRWEADSVNWAGPSRVWTSVTPWVSETPHAGRRADERRRCLLASLGYSFFPGFSPEHQRAAVRDLVSDAQVHEEPWLTGVSATTELPAFRPGPPSHIRLSFTRPVEGPIALGRERLFGMGLLAPVDPPRDLFD